MNASNDGWYIIQDLDGFVNHTRTLVFNSYGKREEENAQSIDEMLMLKDSDQQELDQILSYNEALMIIQPLLKKQINKRTKKIRLIFNDDLYMNIVESLGDRMTSNILHSLVQKGLIETGFDEKANDFVFWIKDENKKKN